MRWLTVGLLVIGLGCDDAAVAGLDIGPDAASEAGVLDGTASESGPPPDAAVDADRAPVDAAETDLALDADDGPDAASTDAADLGAPSDGGLDSTAADVAVDARISDGDVDGVVDGGADSNVESDADPDAEVDAEIDMPWAPAAHRVFMTAEAFTADFDGLAGADAACAEAARAAGLDGTWLAIMSDAETAARDRLAIVGPIETTAGERVAQSADDLWDGAIRMPIAVDARGDRFMGRPDVWTGTDADGAVDARANSFCSNWGADDRPLGAVEIGRGDLTDARWISLYRDGASAYGCGSEARLYCIDGQ